MLSKLIRLLIDSLTYGASNLLGQLIGFILLPLYTRHLTPSDYGVLAMVTILTAVFTPLASQGMKSAVYQRFPRCDDENSRQRMLGTALLGVSANATIALAICWAFAPHIARVVVGDSSAVFIVRLSLLTATLGAINEISQSALQSARRVKTTAGLNLFQLVTTVTTTIVLVVVVNLGVMGAVLGGLIGASVNLLACFALTWRWYKFKFNFSLWRSMAAYGLPYLPHRLLGLALVYFGEYTIRNLLGLRDAGLYNVASRFATPIVFATSAFYAAWQPYKFQIFQFDPNPPLFFRSIFTYCVAGVAYLWLGVSLWGREIVYLMTPPEFHEAAGLVWAIALMRAVHGAYPMLATGIDVGDNTRAVPWASFSGLIVTVAVTPILVPLWGPIGAALATACASLSMALAFYVISQRHFPIPYDWTAVAGLIASAGALVFTGTLVADWQTFPRTGVLIAISVIYPTIVLIVLACSPTERPRIIHVLSRLRKALRLHAPVASDQVAKPVN